EAQLLRRRHIDIAPGEKVFDTGTIEGVNAVYLGDYLLDNDAPATRAAAVVLANFIREPFFSELRTRQQLGYIVGANFGASNRHRYATFIVQSSTHAPDDLMKRAETFIAAQPDALAKATPEQWNTLVAGARATLETKPKSISEKAEGFFALGYTFGKDWDRQQETLAALDKLTQADAVALLKKTLDPATAKRRTVLLHPKNLVPKETVAASFTDRNAWKAKRKFN
ncbi:MAG: hypothetical protein JNJ55_13685, partial [Betaproteobacteria bacterium]|nr:hypothetical protein [Betaproteobacteria bacterium]